MAFCAYLAAAAAVSFSMPTQSRRRRSSRTTTMTLEFHVNYDALAALRRFATRRCGSKL